MKENPGTRGKAVETGSKVVEAKWKKGFQTTRKGERPIEGEIVEFKVEGPSSKANPTKSLWRRGECALEGRSSNEQTSPEDHDVSSVFSVFR